MNYRKLLLAIFVALIIIGIFFFYNTQYKSQKIDVNSYEETSSGLLSKEVCENNNLCRQEFNEYWKCQEIDNNEKCVCIINDEQQPVCGVDGKTYRNPSEPNCLGVEIKYNGECKKNFQIGEGKECASNKDCPKGYYCKEETDCTNSIPPNCVTISNCILRAGCNDGTCNYDSGESPENCPQDCTVTIKQKECSEINEKIFSELNMINYCITADDCKFGVSDLRFSLGGVACCGVYYNKGEDLSFLRQLDSEAVEKGCIEIRDCSCQDIREKQIKCVNNKCTHFG